MAIKRTQTLTLTDEQARLIAPLVPLMIVEVQQGLDGSYRAVFDTDQEVPAPPPREAQAAPAPHGKRRSGPTPPPVTPGRKHGRAYKETYEKIRHYLMALGAGHEITTIQLCGLFNVPKGTGYEMLRELDAIDGVVRFVRKLSGTFIYETTGERKRSGGNGVSKQQPLKPVQPRPFTQAEYDAGSTAVKRHIEQLPLGNTITIAALAKLPELRKFKQATLRRWVQELTLQGYLQLVKGTRPQKGRWGAKPNQYIRRIPAVPGYRPSHA